MITVFCRTTRKAEQSFYLSDGQHRYYLFTQKFRRSNKEFFERGVLLDVIYDFSRTHSTCTIKTLEKIQKFIPYIEKEESLALRRQTRRKKARLHKPFRLRKQELRFLAAEY